MANNWSSNTPTATSLAMPEIEVVHTTGVQTNVKGYSTAVLNYNCDMTLDMSNNLVDTYGNITTLSFPAEMVNFTVNTNILDSDLVYSGSGIGGAIGVGMIVWHKTTATNLAHTAATEMILGLSSDIFPYGGFQNGVSTLNTPALVGDTGTYYGLAYDGATLPTSSILAIPGRYNHIGTNATTFSGGHWTFYFMIPASAASKTYKFQITIDYI